MVLSKELEFLTAQKNEKVKEIEKLLPYKTKNIELENQLRYY